MERPPILHAGSAPAGLAPRSQQHKRTSRPSDPGMSPAQVYGGYMTGLSPVHSRYIDRLCRIQSVTGDIGNRCGATPPLPRSAAVPVFHPSGSDGDSAGASIAASMGWWCGPIRQPAPAAGTNKASPPPGTSRTAKNGTGRPGCLAHQSDEQSGVRIIGQNGRRSAKRAVIRTAPSGRSLYTISTQPLRHIDP